MAMEEADNNLFQSEDKNEQLARYEEELDLKKELQLLASENLVFKLAEIRTKIEEYRTLLASINARAASFLVTKPVDELVDNFYKRAKRFEEELTNIDTMKSNSDVKSEDVKDKKDQEQDLNRTIDICESMDDSGGDLVIVSQNSNNDSIILD